MIARVGRVARSIALLALVVMTIDALPLTAAGVHLDSLLEGLIAVPAALAIVYGHENRRTIGLALVTVFFVLLIALVASGMPQNDAAYNTTILSLLSVALWMCVPQLDVTVPYARMHRLGDSRPIAPTRRAPRVGTFPWFAAIGAGTLVAFVALVAYASRFLDAAPIDAYQRIEVLRALDGAIGSIAVFALARRTSGTLGGIGAAVLWYCCGMRLDYTAIEATGVFPTAFVPSLAAFVSYARGRSVPVPLALSIAAILAGAIGIEWPIVAIVAMLATLVISFAADDRRRIGWLGVAFATAFLLMLEVVHPAATIAKIGLQASVADPDSVIAACSSGCDGALPWEFFYPSPSDGALANVLRTLLMQTFHWGNYRANAVAPGWAELVLAGFGLVALYREQRRVARIFAAGIILGIALSMPSYYLGLTLPSLTRLLTTVAPNFQFGTQFSLLSGLLVALLGGAAIMRMMTVGRRLPRLAAYGLIAIAIFESIPFPVPGHAGAVLRSLANELSRREAIRPKVAFYPYLTDVDGPEFADLERSADRAGIDLLNETGVSNIGDLADPGMVDRLKSQGVRYIVVSLDEYSRRREILRNARLLLPNDRERQSSAWTAPTPERLVSFRSLHVGRDRSFWIEI
ncbi:MAG: hypothetical protein NVS2B3_01210 [Vulcanimicrobiaceae bacterium]